jgi:hypothetical protein
VGFRSIIGRFKVKNDYSKDKKGYHKNVSGGSANDGENQIHFTGNSEGGRSHSIGDSAGVSDGLSHVEGMEVKNAEKVCENQRAKGNTKSSGPFTIGTL